MNNYGSRSVAGSTAGPLNGHGLLHSASVLALLLSGILAMPGAALAEDWTGAVSNDWLTTGNWNTGAVPTPGNNAIIDTELPNAAVVNGGNALAFGVYVGENADAMLTISNGGTLTSDKGFMGHNQGSLGVVLVTDAGTVWDNTSELHIGTAGVGSLTIANGGVVNNISAFVGEIAGGVGTIAVQGAGSTWTNSSDLFLGQFGLGGLTISGGGTVSNNIASLGNSANSIGAATVTGPGSTWTSNGYLAVGALGSGMLSIANGGAVSNTTGYVGSFGEGTAMVDGAGSIWANSLDLAVGGTGTGTLMISDGGMVSNRAGTVADIAASTGSVSVDGAGSTWTSTANLDIGLGGTGMLTISDGGTVNNDIGSLGSNTGSTGTAVVDGAGSAWVNSSGLVVGASGTGTLTISDGGAVSNTDAYVGFNGDGTGSVTVTGAGSTWVNSTSLYVGETGNGTLMVSGGGAVSNTDGYVGYNGGSRGNIGMAMVDGAGSTWTNTGELRIGANGTGTLTISDGGAVSAGTGVVLAGGSYAGTLNIGAAAASAAAAAGTLTAATLRFGPGTGTLNFNHTDANYTFAAALNGLGTLNQIAGTTILSADSSLFTGATNVTGGRLVVNGSLANSLVSVSGSGILGGNGTIGGLVANAGAIIAPGNSIGTLAVAGNVASGAGSIYQVELTSAGLSDLIDATGTATIADGAILDVVKTDAAPYVLGTRYTVLQADGGVTGTYTLTGDTDLSAFIGLADLYDPTHVYLDVIQRSFASVGLTPNQVAAGTGIESLGSGNPLYDAVWALPTQAMARAAFDQLSGEVHASAKGVMIEDSRFLREAALDRLRTALSGAPTQGSDFAVWGHGFGATGSMQGDGNAATLDRNTGGFFFGADGLVANAWRIGVIGGYGRSDFTIGERNAFGSSDNYHVGLYGGTQWGDLAFRSGLAYTWHDISTSRSAAFLGFANTLEGGYGAGTTQAFGELGYAIAAGQIAFEPFANLTYVNLSADGFSETGGAAALSGQDSTSSVTFATLGLRASTGFTLDNGITLMARGMLGWRHAFGDTSTSAMTFPGGLPFAIAAVPVAGDTAIIEAGLDFYLTPDSVLGFTYEGQFGSGLNDQTVRVAFNAKF